MIRTRSLIYSLLAMSFLLTACSWQEYFVLINNTDSAVLIWYQIKKTSGSEIPIFTDNPSVYKLDNSGEIDWQSKTRVEDSDADKLAVKLIVPPQSALLLGTLSNDNYLKYSQKFINGRVFNFIKLEIMNSDNKIEIPAEQFDGFFKKQNGYIKYEIE